MGSDVYFQYLFRANVDSLTTIGKSPKLFLILGRIADQIEAVFFHDNFFGAFAALNDRQDFSRFRIGRATRRTGNSKIPNPDGQHLCLGGHGSLALNGLAGFGIGDQNRGDRGHRRRVDSGLERASNRESLRNPMLAGDLCPGRSAVCQGCSMVGILLNLQAGPWRCCDREPSAVGSPARSPNRAVARSRDGSDALSLAG